MKVKARRLVQILIAPVVRVQVNENHVIDTGGIGTQRAQPFAGAAQNLTK